MIKMINWASFKDIVEKALNGKIKISKDDNHEQYNAIKSDLNQSLFIVAGPGSGKTTVITLRILKLILVDDVDPSEILVTTFTKKAAEELKSRILGWGDKFKLTLKKDPNYQSIEQELEDLNFNGVIAGTLDSIAEDVLSENREPGTPAPTVIEDFVCNALMRDKGLFSKGRHKDQELKDYFINTYRGGNSYKFNTKALSSSLLDLKDRLFHDQVDVDLLRSTTTEPALIKACDAIGDYLTYLKENLLYDFSILEQEFLYKLQTGSLDIFLDSVKFLLVDEYQDTNMLQDKIFFTIAEASLDKGGSIAIVGDDDQSLYRFRGATVDLFLTFRERMNHKFGVTPVKIDLFKNYRSTDNIINFYNDYVSLDSDFQNARVAQKRDIKRERDDFEDYPIIGIFRDDLETLASDLSEFIYQIIHGNGIIVEDHSGQEFEIKIDPEGSPTDISFLGSSTQEFSSSNKELLPLLLRNKLSAYQPAIEIFNPRGQNLDKIHEVNILCGLLLECFDPHLTVQNDLNNVPGDAIDTLNEWRTVGKDYVKNHPSNELEEFVTHWKNRSPLGKRSWDRETPIASVIYKLITWIPKMHEDVEGSVYLEAILRTVTQAALFNSFDSSILHVDDIDLNNASIKDAYWSIFIPIATGAVDINEDLLVETLSRGRLNIMTIFQAKGLEFPLVIVDVGSNFSRAYPAQCFKRFPVKPTAACIMEDELGVYSEVGVPNRTALDRSFDDLIRLYFVAYSRPKDILLLVGLNSFTNGFTNKNKKILNVAIGFDRDEDWIWHLLQNIIHI